MEALRNVLDTVSDYIWSKPSFFPFIVVLLLFTGFLLTLKTRGIQIRKFFHGWKVLLGFYDDPEDEGDISHFQAISSALSATVGIGNIAGVATAIHYGGPGALFWMWITAILGMALKFGEGLLGVKFREITPDDRTAGGPMYYIEKGLGSKFKWMAILFATMLMIAAMGIGNSIQSFTIADQMVSSFSIPTWITGLFSATFIGIVIIGGIKRIGKVTSILAPFMTILYVLAGVTILILNIGQLPDTFALIFKSAFTKTAGVGGFAGATFLYMLVWGIKRGLFSNEAGQGSAPVAHAAAKTDEPAREGIVAMIGPFIDTITVCTITGLVIITTGVWKDKQPEKFVANAQNSVSVIRQDVEVNVNSSVDNDKVLLDDSFKVKEGKPVKVKFIKNHSSIKDPMVLVNDNPYTGEVYINSDKTMFLKDKDHRVYIKGKIMRNGSPLTAWAFSRGLNKFGNWGGLIITFAVLIFGLSTSITWSYYGDRAAYYLFGKRGSHLYKYIFVVVNFLGAIVTLEVVWGFGDIAVGLMAIPNLVALILLSGKIKKESDLYTGSKQLTYKERMQNKSKKGE